MAPVSASVSIPKTKPHLRRGASISPPLHAASIAASPAADPAPSPATTTTTTTTAPLTASSLAQTDTAAGAITPALLAKHHLPGILLAHGPLAIRHITAHLMGSLAGFSRVPPARQRRMIVGALEGRGGVQGPAGEVGGVLGDVVFEKVGWGRWDARQKGAPPRGERSQLAVPAAAAAAADMAISSSYQSEAGVFLQSEEEEDEVMRDVDHSSSSASEDEDVTDEEDWAQMGAGARARRLQNSSPITSDGWTSSYVRSPGGNMLWKTAGAACDIRAKEERDAVEALLALGSV